MSEIFLESLHVYPIKSTSGIDLVESAVEPTGLEWDRRWALVDPAGDVITAREYPRLLEVGSSVTHEGIAVLHDGGECLHLPLTPTGDPAPRVAVFGYPAGGVAVSEAADAWFSSLIGTPCRLVFMADTHSREVAFEHGGREGDSMSYADQCPLLLISRASLEDLNGRLDSPIQMRNFRPNIVVSGCAAYAEDNWRHIQIGGIAFDVSQQCRRCVFTTIDPDSGEKNPRQEPLRTLSSYRRHQKGGVAFGVHLIPRGTGHVKRGDPVYPV